VEFAVGGLWAFLAWDALRKIWLGPTVVYAFENQADLTGRIGFAILAWVLTALAVLDAEHLWLPDWLTLPGIAVGLVWSVLLKQLSYRDAIDYFPKPPIHSDVFKALLDVALSAGLILLIRWVYWLIRRREGIGLGDAKLMAMLGAWLGFSGAILSFGIGVMLGAIAALAMLAIRQKNHAAENWAITKLPLGTFLCIGGIISGLWGSRIIDAYLHWAGF
jgi:leader peptidase (prepilin peptidase)/N-methyltransferase